MPEMPPPTPPPPVDPPAGPPAGWNPAQERAETPEPTPSLNPNWVNVPKYINLPCELLTKMYKGHRYVTSQAPRLAFHPGYNKDGDWRNVLCAAQSWATAMVRACNAMIWLHAPARKGMSAPLIKADDSQPLDELASVYNVLAERLGISNQILPAGYYLSAADELRHAPAGVAGTGWRHNVEQLADLYNGRRIICGDSGLYTYKQKTGRPIAKDMVDIAGYQNTLFFIQAGSGAAWWAEMVRSTPALRCMITRWVWLE